MALWRDIMRRIDGENRPKALNCSAPMQEDEMTKYVQHTIRAVSVGMIALLAACADGEDAGNGTETAAAPQAAAPSTPQNSDRINLANCSQDTNGQVFFQVGSSVLRVPAPNIRDAIPSSLRPPINKEDVKKELQSQAASGGGCPEKPIAASLLIIQDDLGHPLLEGRIGLLGVPPQGLTARFAQVTSNLQKNPTENCRKVGDDLIGCVGTETRGNVQTQVMYVITTDPNQRMSSGGPLSARCVLENGEVQGCNLVDQLDGNVAFDATLKAGNYTVEGLRTARETAIAKVNGLRVR